MSLLFLSLLSIFVYGFFEFQILCTLVLVHLFIFFPTATITHVAGRHRRLRHQNFSLHSPFHLSLNHHNHPCSWSPPPFTSSEFQKNPLLLRKNKRKDEKQLLVFISSCWWFPCSCSHRRRRRVRDDIGERRQESEGERGRKRYDCRFTVGRKRERHGRQTL